MLTTFHWNALGSTVGWWFGPFGGRLSRCKSARSTRDTSGSTSQHSPPHNNTVSCNKNFCVDWSPSPPPPWGKTRGGAGQGGGGPNIAVVSQDRSHLLRGRGGHTVPRGAQDPSTRCSAPHHVQGMSPVVHGGVFAQRAHSAGTAPIITLFIPGTPPENPPPCRSMQDPLKTASGVQNSGPSDP